MDKMLIIGIAGGSGSGKTTLAENLKARFPDSVTIFRHDDYYKRQLGETYEERAKVNYDHPDAFETSLYIEHIKELRAGHAVLSPIYDYTIHNRSDRTKRVEPPKILVLDGILIFTDPELRDLMDIKIYVDTPDDIRILRRILRDVKERERTLDSVINQYLTTVRPMHELFVAPSRRHADVIIPEGGQNQVAIDMLYTRISEHLRGLN